MTQKTNNKAVESTPAKMFCGNARIIAGKFGDFTKISMSKEDINTIVKYMKDNSKEWVNIAIKEKKDQVEGKPTHYLEIDTYEKPEGAQPAKVENDDLPF